jgi:hypothetical protein
LKLLYLVLPILKSFLNRAKRDLNKVQLTRASQRIMQRQQTSTAIDEQTVWEQGEGLGPRRNKGPDLWTPALDSCTHAYNHIIILKLGQLGF